ncbi:unnamed protein product [Zymoseptoria tritici ST99CH_1E4]|uniref:F-box domain-containing protein n=1 Tax=Zymoseptoria tritici ST99CH_1E4 TaxID=1276532 RepID=A0A2H1GPX3_ZYMTR|nr:unnamed protein product [Zymoseptoria tritici ST99CH_1E4]
MSKTSSSLNPWCSVTTFANPDSAEAHGSPSLVFQDADGDHIQRPVPRSTRFHEEKARRVSGLTDRFRGRLVPELRLHQLNRVNLQRERRQFESRYPGDHSDIDQDSPLLEFVSPMDPQAGDLPGGVPFELEVRPTISTHDFRKPEATSYQHTLPPLLEASEEDPSPPHIPTEDTEARRSRRIADKEAEEALHAQHLADSATSLLQKHSRHPAVTSARPRTPSEAGNFGTASSLCGSLHNEVLLNIMDTCPSADLLGLTKTSRRFREVLSLRCSERSKDLRNTHRDRLANEMEPINFTGLTSRPPSARTTPCTTNPTQASTTTLP